MQVQKRDRQVLMAFIRREIGDFRVGWNPNTPEAKAFALRYYRQVSRKLRALKGGGDYINFKSMSNMGLVQRKLILTAEPWVAYRHVDVVFPTSSPHGRIYVAMKNDAGEAITDMSLLEARA